MFQLKGVNYKTLHECNKNNAYKVEVYEKKKEGEKYTILSDAMFKAMFQNEARIKYSCQLLSYLFEVSYEELLKNLVLLKNEVDKNKKNDKASRCDYVAKIEDTYINIEVNNNSSLDILLRNIKYMDKIFYKKLKEGEEENSQNYNYVVQLNLNNFAFEGNEKVIDIYMMRNEEGVVLDDHKIIVNIYIPNLRKKCYTKGIESLEEIEKYLFVLIEKDIEEARRVGGNIEIMEEYIEEAIEVGEENTFGESYDKEEALIDYGEQKKQMEIAKKMLQMKDLKIEQISEATGLDIETIEKLG